MLFKFTVSDLFCLRALQWAALFFCSATAQNQQTSIPFERITELHGLPCPVRKIVQDSMGFIWLGTNEGLAKYDGKKFKRYQSIRNDENSLSNNIVNDIMVDHHNKIWVATNGGICYYDYSEDRFFRISLPDTLEALDLFRIHSLTIDYQNRVWFTTKTKVHLLGPNGRIQCSFKMVNDPSISLKSIYVDRNDRLFVGTNQSNFWVWDICTNEKYVIEVHSPASRLLSSSTTCRFIKKKSADTLLLGSWMGGLNLITHNAAGHAAITHFANNYSNDIRVNIVTGIGILNEDSWWIGTYGAGIFWYHPGKNKYYHQLRQDPENSFSLLDDYINDILIDKDGIVWIASNGGLSKYDRSSHRFTTVSIPVSGEERSIYRMPHQIVEDLTDPKKPFYFITVPGLGLQKFYEKDQIFETVHKLGNRLSCVLDQRIYEVHNAGDSIFVLQNHSLLLYQKSIEHCKTFVLPLTCRFSSARKMVLDQQGNIWIATSSEGLFKISSDGKKCEQFLYDGHAPQQGIQDNTILCLMVDHDGNLWLGSQNSGLSKFNTREKFFTYFRHSKNESHSLPDNSIFDLYEDADYMLWVATENGLTRMDTRTYKMKTFTAQEGLPSSSINSITPDVEGNLWLSTSKGLCYFNHRDGSFHVYSQSDGLAGNRMEGAVCLSKDGTMLFSTNSKISISNPNSAIQKRKAHKLYITSLQVYGIEIPLRRKRGILEPVEINYQHNIFSVEFVALNYANSSKMNYAYKLEGINTEWIYTGNRTDAHFANLQGGDYTLRIKASTYDGQWFESSDQLKIRILPPFWKSKVFMISWVSLLLAIVLIYVRLRMLENRNIQQLRLRIARDLHDEVGSSISGIHLTSHMMMQNKLEPELQNKFVERIQAASKSAIEMMGEIIWSLQPHNDQIEKMIDRMRLYASEFLEAAEIPFEFKVEGQLSGRILPLDVRKDFLLIYKELLNNIAKHSKANFATIFISGTQDKVILKITDNGVGFTPEKNKHGNGLKNIRDRVAGLHLLYKLDTAPGQGTSVEIVWNARLK